MFGQTPDHPFIEKPYLQLGDTPKPVADGNLALLWHARPDRSRWSVEVRTAADPGWRSMADPASQTVDAPGVPKHLVYRAKLAPLVPGEPFAYRVLRDGVTVFTATGKARKSASQPVRFVLLGDCSEDTPGQKAVAYRTFLANPDFVFIAGDIVYAAGRISEYRANYFPVYNADRADPAAGAPLIRSIPFIAAPGNHDTALENFAHHPDALAYFLYWDQPLNGPRLPSCAPKTSHVLTGDAAAEAAFRAAAGPRYPVMTNFSFDYGNAHWTVLDSNSYMDWSNAGLRRWIAGDLAAASGAAWRFVAFHHPGFNSSYAHLTDQWMRQLSPVFEAGKVDLVFSGHVHNYQRTFPLTFAPKPQPDGAPMGPHGEVAGDWKLDRNFADGEFGNGAAHKPNGPIYIVSGAGGAGLYDTPQMSDPSTWQPFTDKFVSDAHSFTQIDIHGNILEMRQISGCGKEIDSFRIRK